MTDLVKTRDGFNKEGVFYRRDFFIEDSGFRQNDGPGESQGWIQQKRCFQKLVYATIYFIDVALKVY